MRMVTIRQRERDREYHERLAKQRSSNATSDPKEDETDEPNPEVPVKSKNIVLTAVKRPQRPDQWKTYPMWD